MKSQIFILGNQAILNLHKTAFLCSRQYPSSIVPKAYDWAIAQREAENCIISGFHSQIEKDVFHYLLKGRQPIILALARGLPKRVDPVIKSGIDSGHILLITPFSEKTTRVSNETAMKRNQMMLEIADDVVIGYASPEGELAEILNRCANGSIVYLTTKVK